VIGKEKILLGIVVAAVAGLAAMDDKYVEVRIPRTQAPDDIPPAPGEIAPFPRYAPRAGRSLFEPYSDLVAPPFAELPALPILPVPIAVPPVRPWIHPDAGSPRHLFFEPAEPREATATGNEEGGEAAPEGANGGAAGNGNGAAPAAGGKPEEKPKIDLSKFDWVLEEHGIGQKIYGEIDLLPADKAAGKSKYLLVVDGSMDFTMRQVNPGDGKFMGGPVPFRARIGPGGQIGFADTFENNYGEKRARLQYAAGVGGLGPAHLRELSLFAMEEARKPKYPRRACWTQAAKDLREILQKSPDDKAVLKDLGQVLRLLQDVNQEADLYQWWLSAQSIAGDEEVTALLGEVYETLALPERALECYEKSLLTRPDGKVRLRQAEILLATGSLEDARKAADAFRRAAQDGERTAGTVGESRSLLAVGDVKGAGAALERVPSNERDSGWYNAAGAVAYANGKLEEALGNFKAAVEKCRSGDPQFAIARTNVAGAMARIAALLPETDAGGGANPARRSALEAAVKAADEALADDPDNYYWPLVWRAYALRALGEKDRAVESLQEAVAAWPQQPYGRFLLGEFLLRDSRSGEARTQFLECARLAPRFPDGLGGVGRARGGAPGEAREYLRRAIELDPKSPQWPLLAARMSILDEGLDPVQRMDEAQKDLVYLLEKVDRGHALALVTLGWVRYYKADADDAIGRWNTAQSLLTSQKPASPVEEKVLRDLQEWVKGAIQKVYKWKNTRIWRDDFNRPDGPVVGNGWNEEEKNVKPSLKEDGVQFGVGVLGNDEAPSLWREWDAAKVLKASWEVTVPSAEPALVEVRFYIPTGKVESTVLCISKLQNGSSTLRVKKDQRTDVTAPIPGFEWPADGKVTFGFVKMNEEKGAITLLLNGKPIAGFENYEIQNLSRSKGGKLRMEVRCPAQGGGTSVNFRVEAAEVWLDVQ
jgi:tetratricopeptide (TPR) repeat protein